jgi:hypothetical protein
METRTFRVEHLTPTHVSDLIAPYVYTDRDDSPGAMSVVPGAVTVREKEDNLERIARVLEEFDVPPPVLRLHFQLIEANGAAGPVEPGIASVVEELTRLFRFQGYRLLGETLIATGEGSFNQEFPNVAGARWSVSVGNVSQPQSGVINLRELTLWSNRNTAPLSTGLTISVGQTVVIGSVAAPEGAGTVILTVRADTSQAGAER